MSATNQDLQSYLDSMNDGNESLVTLSSDVVEALAGSDVLAQKILTDNIDDDLADAVDVGENGYFVVQGGDYYFEPKAESNKSKIKPSSSPSKHPRQTRMPKSSKAIKTFGASTTGKRKKINVTVTESDVERDIEVNEKEDSDSSNKLKYVYLRNRRKRDKPENPDEPEELAEKGKQVFDFDESDEEDDNDKEYIVPKHVVRLKPIVGGAADGNGNVFRCSHCNYTATKRFLLSRHMKAHSTDRPYKCSVCERGFKVSASLLNHVNTHLGNKPYSCKYCEMCFTTSGEMVRHVRYRHTGEKPHKCSECDYSSVEQSKLRRHMRCHTGERPYQCPHCTYASPDMFKLKRHMRTHTGEKPYECDICHARFTQSNSLKAHRLIHSVGDKPVFQCTFCPTTCGRKTDLRMHIQKLHNSTSPIKCKRCDKELPDRYSYKMHVKTHEGEKCYRCTVCSYASVSVRHLESHMLIHSDQKPFVCEHCSLSFRQRQLLKRHINLTHNKDYVPPTPRDKQHSCPHCTRSFTHKGNLMRHMETHDPESDAKQQQLRLKVGRRQVTVVAAATNGDGAEVVNTNDFKNDFDNFEVDYGRKVVLECDDEDDELDGEEEFQSIFDTNCDEEAYEIIETVDEIDHKPIVIANKISGMKDRMNFDSEYSSALKSVSIKPEPSGKEFMSVEGDDGQQYMVVEVIQCDDNFDDDDGHADGNADVHTDVHADGHAGIHVDVHADHDGKDEREESYITVEGDIDDVNGQLLISHGKSKTGVENCFGFEEDENYVNEHDAKAIQLLQIIDDD